MTQQLAHNYDLPADYEHIYSGKVRDLFRTPQERILMVTSDRISAYDWVLPTEIPDKGRILNSISQWWFAQLQGLVFNHTTTSKVPKSVTGRAVVCEPLEMFPVECVVRGYLAGSGYSDYLATRKISGNGLPPGLKEGALLPKPLFTPATKAPLGQHDENITYDVPTVAVNGQLITSADQPDELIYDITKALWNKNTRKLLDKGHAKGKAIQLDTALKGVLIPVHPGAAKFYKEKGLLK